MHVGKNKKYGFTIVELLIVIVVIAVLAAVTIVAYNGVSARAKESVLKNDLQSAVNQIEHTKVTSGSYPTSSTGIARSPGTIIQYSYSDTGFCVTATSLAYAGAAFSLSNSSTIQNTQCPGHVLNPSTDVTYGSIEDGTLIQTITSANCPTTRTMAVDARDNNTYWVQLLADGKCWMLTSLAYAGGTSNGGVSTYGDTKSLSVGASNSYTAAYYFIPTGANPTVNPTQPSTSTTGTGQYGYLYNWCGAMGGQATAACASATTPAVDTTVSVCPAGWRLPTITPTNEFTALNTAINGGLTNTDAGLRTTMLSQRGGYYRSSSGGFANQGSTTDYWSSSAYTNSTDARYFDYNSTTMTLNQSNNKYIGFSVRCIAN